MGFYINSHLTPGEKVIFETGLHWIEFFTLRSLFSLGLAPLIAMSCGEFAVTSKRVIIKMGFISRRTLEMNLAKLESVAVNQTILGRLLGYGSIVLIGSGGTREMFRHIVEPMKFRRACQP